MGRGPGRDTDPHDERRAAWWRGDRAAWTSWLVAAVLTPTVVAGAATMTTGRSIEQDLADRARRALQGAGIDAHVTMDGRDASLARVPAGRGNQAHQLVDDLAGVRTVTVAEAQPASTRPAPAEAEPVTMTFTGDQVALTGPVPDEATRRAMVREIEHSCGRAVIGALQVRPGVDTVGKPEAFGELAKAAAHPAGERTVSWGPLGVVLTGTAPDPVAKQRIENAVRRAVPGVEVHSRLVVTREGSARAARDNELQERLDRLLGEHPITFRPNTAELTAEGVEAVRRAAQLLAEATDRTVEVGGHVAAGPGAEANAVRLSQQRAEVVRRRLVHQGFPAGQVVAKGYGDSRPRADNNTAAGKAANRRVEITVR
ncbi:hypothetical protein GCM10012275_24350 [Longimycelium tulufanense]|uniref:OmpA-like domain-containing protein n=1 Tax=Longimycelium tulufanense TaxID=907463 RepID=A0A8J3C841_9PSEU|nr:OmpA family protein [Longimycelium tulufanense]GGM52501.1 hypothetical protein GCM10012275_24350 [Longimycelium tulufanense]